jgi:predicted Zn-ribbon and HTH transcriptional regulator
MPSSEPFATFDGKNILIPKVADNAQLTQCVQCLACGHVAPMRDIRCAERCPRCRCSNRPDVELREPDAFG